jgi:CDP-diacylglycerol--glycerol-3-phosphate 3-phosphatidyltransferase
VSYEHNIPNFLTLFRVLLIPIFVIVFYLPFHFAHPLAGIIFAIASITDWFDGYLARKWKQSSPFGAFMDPVADKLLVSISLLLLLGQKDINYITLPAIIIVGREILISALREWMAELGSRASVTVSYVGKVKTTLQMIALFLLITFDLASSYWAWLGFVLLYVAAILTLWSMLVYISLAWPLIVGKATE